MVNSARRAASAIAVVAAALLASATAAYPSDPGLVVGVVVVDPLTPSTVYAATSNGLYRTIDAGEHWMWVSATPPELHGLVIDPLVPTTLYAASSSHGVFRSTDAGATWIPIGVSYWWVNAMAVDPTTGVLYAAIDYGVYTWEPTDGTWSQIFWVGVSTSNRPLPRSASHLFGSSVAIQRLGPSRYCPRSRPMSPCR